VLQTRLDPETGEPEGIGFYYDAFSPMAEEHCWSGVRVPLTRGAERPPVAVLSQLDCTNTLDGYAFVDAEGVGTPCNGAPTDPCRDLTSDAFPDGLFCDGFTERCEPACETDADCGGAGRVCLNESIDHRAFVPFCVRAAACGE
jgi:hypothetical protein